MRRTRASGWPAGQLSRRKDTRPPYGSPWVCAGVAAQVAVCRWLHARAQACGLARRAGSCSPSSHCNAWTLGPPGAPWAAAGASMHRNVVCVLNSCIDFRRAAHGAHTHLRTWGAHFGAPVHDHRTG